MIKITRILPKCSKGFTLIEVLVYGFVFSLFLLLTTQVFLTIKITSANSLAMVNLQENYARIFSDLNQTIRAANNVALPISGGSGSTLSLNSGQIVYRVESGVLKKQIGESTLDLSDDGISVSAISFENLGAADQKPSIRIRMTINSNYVLEGGRSITEDLQTTVNLR